MPFGLSLKEGAKSCSRVYCNELSRLMKIKYEAPQDIGLALLVTPNQFC